MSAARGDDYEIDLRDTPLTVTEIAVCLTGAPASVVEAVIAAARAAAGSHWRGVSIGDVLFPPPEDDAA